MSQNKEALVQLIVEYGDAMKASGRSAGARDLIIAIEHNGSAERRLDAIREALSHRPEGEAVARKSWTYRWYGSGDRTDGESSARGYHIYENGNHIAWFGANDEASTDALSKAIHVICESHNEQLLLVGYMRSVTDYVWDGCPDSQKEERTRLLACSQFDDGAFPVYARVAPPAAAASPVVPEGYALVPIVASAAVLDRAVSFALNVSLSSEYTWSDYMRDLWAQMLSGADLSGGD